jgi:hypothetical protein
MGRALSRPLGDGSVFRSYVNTVRAIAFVPSFVVLVLVHRRVVTFSIERLSANWTPKHVDGARRPSKAHAAY